MPRFPALLPLVLVALLPACAPRVLSAPGWEVTALKTRASVKLVSSREFGYCKAHLVGCTVPLGQGCVIMLDSQYFLKGTPRQKVLLLAHEFGHCLDGSRLLYTHNRFGNAGKVYGEYYSPAAEGFAEAYARAYIAQCGDNLAPLGWGSGPDCDLPDPKAVGPQNLQP